MLSFKQYIAEYPSGHKAKSTRSPSQKFLKNRLSEASTQNSDQGSAMSKWDLIRLIADDPSETVLVELGKDHVTFKFVEVEIGE